MWIAVVDDQIQEQEALRAMLTDSSRSYPIAASEIVCFSDGESFLSEFRKRSFCLVLLDICLKRMTGIETAREIRRLDKDVRIVFITVSNGFASESYEVGADAYLLKPYSGRDLDRMLKTVMPRVARRSRQITLPGHVRVPVDHIVFTEYSGHYATLHGRSGRVCRFRVCHSELERMLSRYPSFCCSTKGVIVNFDYVEYVERDRIVLKDGGVLPVSRRRMKAVKAAWADHIFRSL